MGFPTRPSNVRVCQFHHSGLGGRTERKILETLRIAVNESQFRRRSLTRLCPAADRASTGSLPRDERRPAGERRSSRCRSLLAGAARPAPGPPRGSREQPAGAARARPGSRPDDAGVPARARRLQTGATALRLCLTAQPTLGSGAAGGRPRPRCRRPSRSGTPRPRTSPRHHPQAPFAPTESGQAARTLSCDERLEPRVQHRGLLAYAAQATGLRKQILIEVQRCSHMYQSAYLMQIGQVRSRRDAAASASPRADRAIWRRQRRRQDWDGSAASGGPSGSRGRRSLLRPRRRRRRDARRPRTSRVP